MSTEDSHQGALVCKVDVEVLWEPGNFQDDGAKRVGVCFASNTDLELWTEEVEQGVIDNMIVFQKPFPGAARTELESQLQRAVKVSAKGKHVKCKMDLERLESEATFQTQGETQQLGLECPTPRFHCR